MAFKEGLSKFTKSISEGASTVVQKSNELIELNKLNNEISNEEKKKNTLFIEIGKLIYDNYVNKADLSEEIKNKCVSILEHDEQIEKINTEILLLKKIKKCPGCGTELDISINFCPKCGTKQETIIINEPAKDENDETIKVDSNDIVPDAIDAEFTVDNSDETDKTE